MTPGAWPQDLLTAVGGLVAVYIVWSQVVAWRTAQTRQGRAEDMVHTGADPREAANAAASPVSPAMYVLELEWGER